MKTPSVWADNTKIGSDWQPSGIKVGLEWADVPTAVSAKAIYYLTCEDTSYLTTEAGEHIILDDSVSTMKVISKWGGTSKTAQDWGVIAGEVAISWVEQPKAIQSWQSQETSKNATGWNSSNKTAQNWATYDIRITESGDTRLTEDGDTRIVEQIQSEETSKVTTEWDSSDKTAQNWATYNTRVTESGDTRITEDGDVRMIEEAQYTPKPNAEWTEN